MKKGDIVMFVDNGRYAKWFWGKLGIAENVVVNHEGKEHCRVKWIEPVKYFDRFAKVSSFKSSSFMIVG